VEEKELKFKLSNIDPIIEKIKELGFEELGENEQEDIYFDSIDNKLLKEGKALRIRKEGNRFYLTFKSKALSRKPKIRKEINMELNETQVIKLKEILKSLGYNEVLKIIKKRREFKRKDFRIAIDKVEGLGVFLEIEYENEIEMRELLHNFGLEIEDAIEQTYPEMLKI